MSRWQTPLYVTLWIALTVAIAAQQGGEKVRDPKQRLERTSFQTAGPYRPEVDIKSDVAMVYGINGSVAERMQGWREKGYIIHLMTGVAWGEYQDYFSGKWDGRSHEDEAQTDRYGRPILHHPTVPYVAPSETYGRYLCVGVQRAIDAGAEAVHLEEPEFWVRAGYSGSFQREWQAYYREPWIPPHSSPDAQYRASKLKYFLYRRALQQVFDYVQDYNRRTGRNIRCYVPTHSMINYAHWRIVSPEQSLVLLNGCDGYIGQVWTGTARTPNLYRGVLRERTFETAFFEYGVLHNLVRSTGRRMYYLNDPVEDDPNHSWRDYRTNWECTLVASLLWHDVWRYEVTPWPERPFLGRYPVREARERKPGEPEERVGISPEYATELMTVFNALNDMNQPRVAWDCGTQGIGVLVSDTMMFQRGDPHPGDPHLGSFYGLSLPLLKAGVPAHPVQMENIGLPGYLKPYRVLFLTYEGQKPPNPEIHARLAEWVRGGGALILADDGSDPYNAVREWWNSEGRAYAGPMDHLRELLDVTKEGTRRVGRGAVIWRRISPAALTRRAEGAEMVLSLAQEGCRAVKLAWRETNYLLLRRGPYVIAAGLDETETKEIKTIRGRFINLFDPKLKPVSEVALQPGTRWLLLDMERVDRTKPRVLASAARTLGARVQGKRLRFHADGPKGVIAATRIALPSAPTRMQVGALPPDAVQVAWDPQSQTALLEWENVPEGVLVEVQWE